MKLSLYFEFDLCWGNSEKLVVINFLRLSIIICLNQFINRLSISLVLMNGDFSMHFIFIFLILFTVFPHRSSINLSLEPQIIEIYWTRKSIFLPFLWLTDKKMNKKLWKGSFPSFNLDWEIYCCFSFLLIKHEWKFISILCYKIFHWNLYVVSWTPLITAKAFLRNFPAINKIILFSHKSY